MNYSVIMSKFFFLLACLSGPNAMAALTIPPLSGPVVDEVGIVEAGHNQFLESNLRRLLAEQKVQVQVFVIKSLDGFSIEEAAIQTTDRWKLGTSKEDKGLLVMVAPNEKKVRIEVGQGLEGDIPDAYAKRIIDQVITPRFRQGEMSTGIVEGVMAVTNIAAPTFEFSDAPVIARSANRARGIPRSWLLILAFIIFFFLRPFGRRRGVSPLGGFILGGLAGRALGGGGGGFGGGGGGGWGGGGGGFSGGGASGGW